MESDPAVNHEMLAKLRENGWRRTKDGWRHPRLEFSWPVWFAVRLQNEADRGKRELIHKLLREEVWPA